MSLVLAIQTLGIQIKFSILMGLYKRLLWRHELVSVRDDDERLNWPMRIENIKFASRMLEPFLQNSNFTKLQKEEDACKGNYESACTRNLTLY